MTDSTNAGARSKSTLFCPECGHRSRYDGDWLRIEERGGVRYLCPDCHTEITVRSTERAETAGPASLWRTWADSLQAWQHAWLHTLLHP